MSRKISKNHSIEKNEKKKFRKTGLPVKPEHPENRETSETFFS
jgi:hypothetical protein